MIGLATAALTCSLVLASEGPPSQEKSSEDYQDWRLDLAAQYDTNAAGLPAGVTAVPQFELSGDIQVWKGTAFFLSEDKLKYWNLTFGADADLKGSATAAGLNQAIPSVWIGLSWSTGPLSPALHLEGSYHLWGVAEANAIEPSATLTLHSPTIFSTKSTWLGALAQYRFTMRLPQTDNLSLRNAYGGVVHRANAYLTFGCHVEMGCPGVVPDSIRVGYVLEAGDLLFYGPSDPSRAGAVTAPSTLYDGDTVRGWNVYRVPSLSHGLLLEIGFTDRFSVGFTHRILAPGTNFAALDERIEASYSFW